MKQVHERARQTSRCWRCTRSARAQLKRSSQSGRWFRLKGGEIIGDQRLSECIDAARRAVEESERN